MDRSNCNYILIKVERMSGEIEYYVVKSKEGEKLLPYITMQNTKKVENLGYIRKIIE